LILRIGNPADPVFRDREHDIRIFERNTHFLEIRLHHGTSLSRGGDDLICAEGLEVSITHEGAMDPQNGHLNVQGRRPLNASHGNEKTRAGAQIIGPGVIELESSYNLLT
jgi:hypothetical protein